MKMNLPVTEAEHDYPESIRIISLTDPKGRIIQVNQDFIDVCGFTEEELQGQNHNIVRHPTMPPAAFANLWTTLQQGKPWMGVVKNRCKDGNHYWVNAYVTPVYREGNVVAYQSVRTKPRREWVNRAEYLYADINRGKASLKLRPFSTSQRYAANGVGLMALFAVVALLGGADLLLLLPGLLITSAMQLWQFNRIGAPLRHLAEESRAIFDNAIAPHIYGDRPDDLGQIQCAIAALQARITTLVTRLGDATDELSRSCQKSTDVALHTSEYLGRQRNEMEQAATAVKEMVATIADVAQNTQRSADAAQQANSQAARGGLQVNEVAEATLALSGNMARAAETIRALNNSSENIGGLLAVIQNIAEQTNLLALNAAIEAARAGEQGRGFAVVADEVRSLATRTQGSTEEIEAMIRELRSSALTAVTTIEDDLEETQRIAEQARQAAQEFGGIESSIHTIADMSIQIASATEQQTVAADEISKNIDAIHELTEDCNATAKINYETNTVLKRLTDEMKNTVRQFG